MMTRMQLSDKVVVILGGSGLLGSACVHECIGAGAKVVVVDIHKPAVSTRFAYFQCDATDETQMIEIVQKIKKDFKRVDGVVNATYPAATRAGDNGAFMSGNLRDKLESVSKHLCVCFAVIRAFSPLFKEQGSGSIVFVSSIYGMAAPRFELYDGLSMTQPAEYAAAKGGVIAITRYFASLLGKDGVRVNVVSPGGITAGQAKSFVEAYSKRLLFGSGLLLPEHISGAVAFLLSDASLMMTGQNLVVDGGWTV